MRRHTYTDDELLEAVKASTSMAETLRALRLVAAGANYSTLRRRVARLGIDTSHWLGKGHLKGKTHNWARKRPLDEILVENSDYVGSRLRRRLVREGLLERHCANADCMFHEGELIYRGHPVGLHLDHINGDRRDNRIENLRLLCPLCHSQTSTYAGKNWGKYHVYAGKDRTCVDCGKPIARTLRCPECTTALARSRDKQSLCKDCKTRISKGAARCMPCHALMRKKKRDGRGGTRTHMP